MTPTPDRLAAPSSTDGVGGPDGVRSPGAFRFWLWAVVLLVVTLVFRTAVMGVGWFHADDFAGIARSRDPFRVAVEYGEGGHVAWVQNAWNWWFAQLFAYQWPAYVLSTMVGFAVMSVLLLVLLRRLWGPRPAVLGLWSVWLFASLVTASTTWHSQSLLFFFLVAPCLAVALAVERASCAGSSWWVVVAVVAFVAALLCSERAVGLVPTLAVLVVLARSAADNRLPGRRTLGMLAAFVAVAVVFLGFYLLRGGLDVDRAPVSFTDRLTMWREGAAVIVTGLTGGPWTMDSTPVVASGAPTVVQVVLALALLVAVALLCALRAGWRATAAWLLLAGYAVFSVVLVTAARASVLGIASLRDVRYYSDLEVALVLAVGIGLLGPARGRWWPVVRPTLLGARGTIGVLAVALAALTVSTSVQIAARWSDNPARGYFANVFADLDAHPGQPMVDTQLPAEVITPLLTTDTLAARLLVGFPGAPVFGSAAPELGTLDPDGHVRPAVVDAGTTSLPGPVPGCGYGVTPRGVEVPLAAELFDWNWLVRLDYQARGTGDVTVRLGDGPTSSVPIVAGSGSVYLATTGGGSSVTITSGQVGTGLCVSTVRVGNAVPDLTRTLSANP